MTRNTARATRWCRRCSRLGCWGAAAACWKCSPADTAFCVRRTGTPGADDIYVSIAQIRRFNLHSGDEIIGKTRPKRLGDRYNALMYIESVNGDNPEIARMRRPFDSLTPIHPNRRLTLECADGRAIPPCGCWILSRPSDWASAR